VPHDVGIAVLALFLQCDTDLVRSRTYSMASLARRAARSIVLRMVGASARVRWSSLRASRSDKSRAVDSMLRRS
jgi:hypothetical protein